MEEEDIVVIRYQAVTGEDRRLASAVMRSLVCGLERAL
jgi:hypothetical protein